MLIVGCHPIRGLSPNPWVVTQSVGCHPQLCYATTTWFNMVCSVSVGYHPRLWYVTATRFYVVYVLWILEVLENLEVLEKTQIRNLQ